MVFTVFAEIFRQENISQHRICVETTTSLVPCLCEEAMVPGRGAELVQPQSCDLFPAQNQCSFKMLKPTVALDIPLAEYVDETTNNVSDHPVYVPVVFLDGENLLGDDEDDETNGRLQAAKWMAALSWECMNP